MCTIIAALTTTNEKEHNNEELLTPISELGTAISSTAPGNYIYFV